MVILAKQHFLKGPPLAPQQNQCAPFVTALLLHSAVHCQLHSDMSTNNFNGYTYQQVGQQPEQREQVMSFFKSGWDL